MTRRRCAVRGASGFDASRNDAVDGDPVRRKLERQRLGHPGETRLRGDDMSAARSSAVPRFAAHVDDRSASGTDDMRCARLCAEKGAIENHRQNASPILKRHADEGLLCADRCVVHQRVEASEAIDRHRHHAQNRFWIGDIAGAARRGAAGSTDRVHGLRQLIMGIESAHHDACASLCQRLCNGPPDVASSPGDQYNLPRQLSIRIHGSQWWLRSSARRKLSIIREAKLRRLPVPMPRTGGR